MSVVLNTNTNSKEDSKIHYMPCNIQYNGNAEVTRYFETSIKESENNEIRSSFRGRPLKGQIQDVPSGYTGVILTEVRRPFSEEEDRNLNVTHKFKKFHFWNLDRTPSADDKMHQAMQWIDIAKELHKPISSEDSQRFALDSQNSVIDK